MLTMNQKLKPMKPLTADEERELAQKYLRVIEGKSEHSGGKGGAQATGPSSVPAEMAAKMLHRLTGRDHGTDAKAWGKFVGDHYGPGQR